MSNSTPSNPKLNVQFNEKQGKALEEMAGELGTSKAAVLKTALSLLQLALREKKEGRTLGVVQGDRVVKEIVGLE